MKTLLAFLLIILPVAGSYAADNDHHDQDSGSNPTTKALADQIGNIAHSSTLTLKEKDADILTVVHNAVLAATDHITNPADILKITEELTTAAAGSAPQFANAIIDAISNISSITSIHGALNEIKDSVVDAAAKAAEAEFDSDHDRDRDHDHHHGDDDDDDDHHPCSPSH